jgi:hypothetical protein
VWGDVIVSDQSSNLTIDADNTTALTINDHAAVTAVVFDTTTATPRVDFTPAITAPDISVTGTDGYIEFGSENFDGATGIGIRNNTSSMEVKHGSGSEWGTLGPIQLDVLSGGGAAGQPIAAADAVSGQEKQGSFDIGPIRIIFNTFDHTGTLTSVTLGTGDGTGAAMDSTLYSVMISTASTGTQSFPQATVELVSASAGTFEIHRANAARITYWAIGDSGL